MERAAREADYLRHAADELKALKPKDGEETALAGRRATMMQGEKIAADLREAQDAVSGHHSPVAALAAAVRRLERRAGNSPTLVEPAVKAIDAAINALEKADQHLERGLTRRNSTRPNSNGSRSGCSHCAPPAANMRRGRSLPALAAKYVGRVARSTPARPVEVAGRSRRRRPKALCRRPRRSFPPRAPSGGEAQKAVNAELAPLKLERAKFDASRIRSGIAGPEGFDRVEFWVQTNPGTRPGPLMKVASGGELARFLPRPQGGAGRPRLGADAGVRRNRYRGRRRGCRCHRRAAGAARRRCR